MAKKHDVVEEQIVENISVEPLEDVMGDRYATYAKYVIQDRAIPDVRDGLKPVQRRIIFSMYKSGNTFNKPTKKCAHTVGAVMGTYHPHGDTSIYEALARMSQDWKVRYPLIDFQGNNGSIDGDYPAAYRYTESRLSELSNELVADIEKKTVDMQFNFDDTELEPTVLPAKFPNLLVNGTEGIAVALATEIPPHNLKEVIDAVVYRIQHKDATVQDLMQFVKGPDFPTGGFIYNSPGLEQIYQTGRGRIEIAAKTEIVEKKDINQIIITEVPYKVVKIQLVYEIDKIRHSKAIDGIIEVRDESDYKGIRIVIDVKKTAKVNLVLQYLMKKTNLVTGYTANMVAIVNGRPKTLSLLDFVDAYIEHQVDVLTRKSKFDLQKYSERLHIVEGLILASLNINEVVDIIRKSKDKADSKVNLIKRYGLTNEQAEAIVTMPLYKLSHTDELILEKEKAELENSINYLNEILADPNKLNRAIVKDLKNLSNKYGDERRTLIIEKGETEELNKRDLIAKEEVMIAVSYDGYLKRSSIRSYSSSNGDLPGLKDGDMLVATSKALTTDYVICFTNLGNYAVVPVHSFTDNKWKDEGTHINEFTTLSSGEKIIKVMTLSELRNDLFLVILTKFGQIKRMSVGSIDLAKHSRPVRYMKLLSNDSITGVELVSGNSDLLVITNNGKCTFFNENELTVLGNKAGGVKSTSGLGSNYTAALLAFEEEDERTKILIFTDKGHMRVTDINKFTKTNRLGKTQFICPSFKGDQHNVVSAYKVTKKEELDILLYLNDKTNKFIKVNDFRNTEAQYAKKNIDELTLKQRIAFVYYNDDVEHIGKDNISHAPKIDLESIVPETDENDEENNVIETSEEVVETVTEAPVNEAPKEEASPKEEKPKEKEEGRFEQISIFDDLD